MALKVDPVLFWYVDLRDGRLAWLRIYTTCLIHVVPQPSYSATCIDEGTPCPAP